MKRITLLMTFMFASLSLSAQTALVGMTYGGGNSGIGTLFGIIPGDTLMLQQHDFFSPVSGANPYYTQFIETSNGKLYGMTDSGGIGNRGMIFEYDYVTNTYTSKLDFIGVNGAHPNGSLFKASNGKLYGMTNKGGSSDFGVFFEYDYMTNTYIKLVDFYGVNGRNPTGTLMEASNGKLYGMTTGGGLNGNGMIFEYDYVTNTYTKKIDFYNPTGGSPIGCLTQAANGKLYGVTGTGGVNNSGVIFDYNYTTNVYTVKVDLDYTFGAYPSGSLSLAPNGKFYGLTRLGGTQWNGVIFEYDFNTNTYLQKIAFNDSMGNYPNASLFLSANGKFYGTTSDGGSNDLGTIFEYDYSTNTCTRKINLSFIIGYFPLGTLMQAANGKLYGMTFQGGVNNKGVIFEYDYLTNSYIKKIDLYTYSAGRPRGSLLEASNNKLYGLVAEGGTNASGSIIEYDFAMNTFTPKVDFNGINGKYPYGSLMQASNGKLYGMTNQGGVNDFGVIFEYDYMANTCSAKVDLGLYGARRPVGSLIEAANGKLYGMTSAGGASNLGVVFKYDFTTNSYTPIVNLIWSDGSRPFGSLIEAANGKLYGLTSEGGSINYGVLFEFDIITDTYIKKVEFIGSNGRSPMGSMIEAANGKLYGMTSKGGVNNMGVLFEYDYTANTYTKKIDFNGANGSAPFGSLKESVNGKIYGMTNLGGTHDYGVLFEYDYATNALTKKLDFTGPNGANPAYGQLIEINIPSATQEITDAMETTVYPNPAIQKATISFKALRSGRAEIRVMDLAGRIVIKSGSNAIRGVNSTELNLISCNPGLYLLQITDAGGNTSVKRLAVE